MESRDREAIEGIVAWNNDWIDAARMRQRLLSTWLPDEGSRIAELQFRLQLWEQGELEDHCEEEAEACHTCGSELALTRASSTVEDVVTMKSSLPVDGDQAQDGQDSWKGALARFGKMCLAVCG